MKPKTASNKKKPSADKKDIALMATRTAFSIIPFGGPVAAILSGFKPSYAKQLITDVEEIDKRLKQMENRIKGFSTGTLHDDEDFQAAVVRWIQIAIRTRDKEKREALRNAVVNLAIKNPPEEDLRSIFLKWADDLEPWHLVILKFLDDPKTWAKKNVRVLPIASHMTSISDIQNVVFPELKGRTSLYVKELIDKELITDQSYNALQRVKAMLDSRTTPIGKQFLSFITSPIDDSQPDTETDSAMKEGASKS